MARGLTIFCVLCVFTTSLTEGAFLPDYEYIEGVGWLRLHIVPATWPDAQLRCHLEDATLTAPTTSAITAAMKRTMVEHRLNESSVFTDIYASNPKGDFTSINGLPLSNITLQWAVGEPNNLGNAEDCLVMTGAGELADVSCSSVHPFFCLKRNTTRICNITNEVTQSNIALEANQCDTPVGGYTLDPRTGSCYRLYYLSIPWYRAAIQCASDHGHLAVINSEEESRVLQELYAKYIPYTTIDNDNDFAHIGFLDWNQSGQWLTVFGETLYEAGFNTWKVDEPNNYGNDEYCGSMSRFGKLNDSPCVAKNLPYICEITPK